MSTETPESTDQMQGEVRAAPRRGGRWLKIALFVSLAVNLLIVGAVIGRVGRGPVMMMHSDGPHAAWNAGRQIFRELPLDRRIAILGAMRGHRGAFDARRSAVRDARRHAAEVLKRQGASDREINQAFDDLGREEGAAVEAMRAAMGDVVVVMTPDERRTFARRVLGGEQRGFGPDFR